MIQTILLPLDGSRLAEAALPEARRLARQSGATLVLMRVATVAAIIPDAAAARDAAVAESADYLQRVAHRLATDGFSVRTALYCANPAEGIVLAATEEHTDLIVMSTHGRSGLRRVVLGSVAEAVVRDATIPVLLVRAFHHPGLRREGPYRKVLVPLDRTELAARALRYVARAPFTRGAEVELLYSQPAASATVAPGLMGYVPQDVFEQAEKDVERRRAEARSYLEAMALSELRGQPWNAHVAIGEPGDDILHVAGDDILHVAGDDGIELIAMATHGRSGLDRLVHGSVAAHVLHHTDVPLLLVRDTAVPDPAHVTEAPDSVHGAVAMETPASAAAPAEDALVAPAR